MAKTYSEVVEQISALQAKADQLKQSEIDGVVGRIKEAIATYGISPEELFGKSSGIPRKKSVKASKSAGAAKYSDGKGGFWGGMGPRPRWLREALSSGGVLADFRTTPSDPGARTQPDATPARKREKERSNGLTTGAKRASPPSRAKYRDGVNSWSGMGPKPRWLKDALAAGVALEAFTQPAD